MLIAGGFSAWNMVNVVRWAICGQVNEQGPAGQSFRESRQEFESTRWRAHTLSSLCTSAFSTDDSTGTRSSPSFSSNSASANPPAAPPTGGAASIRIRVSPWLRDLGRAGSSSVVQRSPARDLRRCHHQRPRACAGDQAAVTTLGRVPPQGGRFQRQRRCCFCCCCGNHTRSRPWSRSVLKKSQGDGGGTDRPGSESRRCVANAWPRQVFSACVWWASTARARGATTARENPGTRREGRPKCLRAHAEIRDSTSRPKAALIDEYGSGSH